MAKVKIRVVYGMPDIHAYLDGKAYTYKEKEFDTLDEAKGYMQGINDANGYMEAGILFSGNMGNIKWTDLDDLQFIETIR